MLCVVSFKSWTEMTKKCQKKLKSKGMVLLTHKITIPTIINTENCDALQTLRINLSQTIDDRQSHHSTTHTRTYYFLKYSFQNQQYNAKMCDIRQ